uniref:Uncharacterized protein MANES_02G197600 n=1 Tax=Rhizophora mucronata TaxID=61149 RepID=A0A2P2PKD3_RHIMU
MRHKRSKICPHNTVPSRPIYPIKLLFQSLSQGLGGELLKTITSFPSTINGMNLHKRRHID